MISQHPKCTFQNKFMTNTCGKPMLKNHNEWYCPYHGTMTFEREAWDSVETPDETYEAENGGQAWSQEELDVLIAMSEDGESAATIARRLGRSKNAVYNKIWALR